MPSLWVERLVTGENRNAEQAASHGWVEVAPVGDLANVTHHAVIWAKGLRGTVAEWVCAHAHRGSKAAIRCAKREAARRRSMGKSS